MSERVGDTRLTPYEIPLSPSVGYTTTPIGVGTVSHHNLWTFLFLNNTAAQAKPSQRPQHCSLTASATSKMCRNVTRREQSSFSGLIQSFRSGDDDHDVRTCPMPSDSLSVAYHRPQTPAMLHLLRRLTVKYNGDTARRDKHYLRVCPQHGPTRPWQG
jgi:hypothetical protein